MWASFDADKLPRTQWGADIKVKIVAKRVCSAAQTCGYISMERHGPNENGSLKLRQLNYGGHLVFSDHVRLHGRLIVRNRFDLLIQLLCQFTRFIELSD